MLYRTKLFSQRFEITTKTDTLKNGLRKIAQRAVLNSVFRQKKQHYHDYHQKPTGTQPVLRTVFALVDHRLVRLTSLSRNLQGNCRQRRKNEVFGEFLKKVPEISY